MLTLGRQRGFNLIEALVVLAVMGILMAAALPTAADWIKGTRVRSIAETTTLGLQKARAEAIKRNKVVTLWLVSPATTARPDNTCKLSAGSGAWVISLDDPTDKCGEAPSPSDAPRIVEVYGPGPAGQDVVVKAVDAAGADATFVTFNAYGHRTGGGISTIDVSHASGNADIRVARIEVTASGGIRRCDPVVTVADPDDPRACTKKE